jgi:digeranylgeranylglycerophospholipid reductase
LTDVVVIGASVAGLAAATSAAEEGVDVTLLDRRTGPAEQTPPAAVAFDALWPPTRELVSAESTRYELVRLRAGSRTALVRAGARLYDRGRLDTLLAGAAARAGANIVWGVHDLTIEPDRTVRWRRGSTKPKVLILADGPDGWASKFVENLDDPSEIRFGQAWRIARPLGAANVVEMAFVPELPGGRLQINPAGTDTTVWAFQYERPPTRKTILGLHPSLQGLDKDELVSLGPPRPDPVLALPGRITADALLVTGGAAGQGGLELGFSAGTDAGRAAATAVQEDRVTAGHLRALYEEPWKERWMPGLERFRSAYNKFTSMTPAEQERILEPWEHAGLDLHDVTIPIRRPGVGRSWAALKTSLRNARRMRALLHTYRQLKD